MSTGKTYSTKYLLDSNNNRGAEGQVLSTTSTGIDWVDSGTLSTGLWLKNGNNIYNSNSGSVGIGITSLSDWGWIIDHALQFANGAFVAGRTDSTAAINLGSNAFVTATGGNAWKYFAAGAATRYIQQVGEHYFQVAGVGAAAGDTITWSTALNIANNGNVGIGVTGPSKKLHVVGDQLIFGDLLLEGSANSFRTVSMNTVDGSDNQTLSLCGGATSSSARGGRVDIQGNEVSSTGGTVKIVAGNVSTGGIELYTANTQRMIINNAGNVGIGEDNPTSLLHLYKASGDPMINIQAVSGGDPGITFTSINNRTGNIFYSDGTTNAKLTYDHADTSFKLYAHNTSVADFVLNETTSYFPTQNVGIGTTTPQEKLHIEGTGAASEMQILVSGASDTVGHTAGIGLRAEGGESNSSVRIKGGIFFERIAGSFGNGKMILAVNSGVDNNSVTVADHALTIDNNKNVGIGVTSPDAPLHILKAAGGANIVTALKLDPDDATADSGVSIDFNASTTNTGASLVGSRIVGARQGGNASGFLALYTSPDASGSVPLERMRIDSAGNVGIGRTTDIAKKLDVLGAGLRLMDTSSYSSITIGASGWQAGYPYQRLDTFSSDGTGYYWALGHKKTDGTKTIRMLVSDTSARYVSVIDALYVQSFTSNELGGSGNYPSFSTNVILRNNGVSYINGGNVGIGVTAPSTKLHVKGDMVTIEDPSGGYKMELSADNNPVTIRSDNRTGSSYGSMAFVAGNGSDANDITRMIIDTSGNVGIGTDSPSNYNSYADNLVVADSAHSGISIASGTTSLGTLMFADGTGGTAGYRGRVQYDHNTDSMNFHTAAAERMRISSTGAIKFNAYGAGTLVTDASGNITASSGGGAGGPYLPLSAGPSYPLTGDLYQTMGAIGVAQTDQDYIAKIYELNSDGFLSLYTGQPTPLEKVRISSYGDSFFVPANNGNVGIGTTTPNQKITIGFADNGTDGISFRSTTYASLGKILCENDNSSTNGNLQFHTRSGGDILERMRIDSSGNVGIGISPVSGARLTLGTGSVANEIISFASASGGNAELRNTSSTGTFTFTNSDGSSEKMRILANGNVGIGTTSPGNKLSIAEDMGTTFSDAFLGLKATLAATANTRTAISLATSTANNYGVTLNGIRQEATSGEPRFGINMHNNSSGGIEAFTIRSSGNVGIGTSSPNFKLGLSNSTALTAVYQQFTNGTTGTTSSDGTVMGIDSDGDFLINNQEAKEIKLYTSDSQRLTIQSGGNVGIGMTSPGSKLHVLGGVTLDSYSVSDPDASSRAAYPAGQMFTHYTEANGVSIIGGAGGYSGASLTIGEETTRSSNFKFIRGISDTNGGGNAAEEFWVNGIGGAYFAGNVGIGTVTPDQALDVEHGNIRIKSNNDGNNGILMLYDSAGTQAGQVYPSAGGLRLYSPNDIIMIPDGNVGIGTTSPGAKLDVRGTGNFLGTAATGAPLVTIENNSGSTATSYGLLVKGGGNSLSGKTFEVRDDSGNTDLIVKGNGNVGINNSAPNEKLSVRGNIELVGEGVGNCGVRYIKYNCPDDASYNVLGLTTSTANFITKVGINKTSPAVKLDVSDSIAGSGFTNGLARFENTIETSSGGAGVLNVANNYQGGFGTLIKFWFEESSVASINFNSSTNAVVYNTTSDYRLKEDLKSFNGLEIVDQIKTYNYKWKKADARGYGALAHELQEVFPDAVTGEKDGEDMQGVDYSTLVPVLIKSIQELKAEIELLKQQINN